ncbi:MAG: cytochrome bc complex cytochrome b subunit [Thermoleophilaceae bacterium]|nr:cytochrome bc complex cytochrome b subunit [Thermoleophilaceae bacterium]
MIARAVRYLDERVGTSPAIKKALRYVFPDHWSFLLGEIALYAFVVLVGTGVFLTFWYEPSTAHVTYHGQYEPLQGLSMSKAYESVVDISFAVPAGLLIRQTHHWAADVFVVAIVLHLVRVFFTGAFRKPRDVNYYVGVTMLALAVLEGYLGYSMVDDLLSGMGLAIGYSVAMSLPVVGGPLAFLLWGGEYPGASSFLTRLLVVHVLIIPVALGLLIAVHLATIVRQHHSQFPGPGRTERNTVGTPLWPGYALRSIGLLLAVASVLVLLGGLIQINPIWEWGPYATFQSTNGAQPDWYLGWLIGALRLMPPWELHFGDVTLIPATFWGGALFPLAVFAFLYSWPALERRLTGDRRRHDLLERPRDNPVRTAVGAAFATWVFVAFVAGSTDRVFVQLGIAYTGQVWFWRVFGWIAPFAIFWLVKRVCEELKRTEAHPLRGWSGAIAELGRGGDSAGYTAVEQSRESPGSRVGRRGDPPPPPGA